MGVFLSAINQNWPPKSKWSVDDIPNLSGKVAIVTGGNSGIGRETVKALLAHKAKVYILSRDPTKSTEAINILKSETGQDAHFIQVDLADLPSIRRAAEEFKR
jgi:NAD(P)-dependent dehydrogenase (short-subunit alcohol dehydrogenase family)